METEVVLGPDNEITGFRHKWTFDEGYTSFAIDGLDTNGDGIYSEEELKPLAQTNIEALKEFEYFTFPFIGETKLPTEAAGGLPPGLQGQAFDAHLHAAAREARLSRQDQGFQLRRLRPRHVCLAHVQRQEPVKIASAKPVACAAHVGDRDTAKAKAKVKETTLSQLGENIDPSSNLGYQYAERVTIQCKPRAGVDLPRPPPLIRHQREAKASLSASA